MKILIATDKFKGSISAPEVTSILAREIALLVPKIQILSVPLADGGDGSLEVICYAGYERVHLEAPSALGIWESSSYGISADGSTAFIELAELCGIAKLRKDELDPWRASTKAVGIAIRDAMRRGVRSISLSIGGSASIDGGSGLIEGLGARLLDKKGNSLPGNLESLREIESVDLTFVEKILSGIEINILSDVENPLVGPLGSAAVYGEQKGLQKFEIAEVDSVLSKWARRLQPWNYPNLLSMPFLGSGGGAALPLVARFNSKISSGSEFFFSTFGLENLIPDCDLIITGEGAFDQQSFMGKIVGKVVKKSLALDKPLSVITGIAKDLKPSGFLLIELSKIAGSSELSIRNPEKYLRVAAREIVANYQSALASKRGCSGAYPF